jgi:uncharacterized protein with von Willebrand factor type A (vWA) domain
MGFFLLLLWAYTYYALPFGKRRIMRRKIVILFVAAFTSIFGAVACGTEADVQQAEKEVKEAEQNVEEAEQEVKVKEAEKEEKEAELKVQEEKQEEKQEKQEEP